MNVSMSSTARSLAASATGTDRADQPLIMSQGSTITEDLPEFKGGRFGIEQIELPQRVAAGEQFTVAIQLFNGFAAGIECGLDDQDICGITIDTGPCSDIEDCVNCDLSVQNGVCGICHEVTVDPGWGPSDSEGFKCLMGKPIGVPTYTQEYTFTAPPDSGTYAVDIEVQLSGGATKSKAIEVTVEPRSCTGNADCGADEVCRSGICVSPGETCTSDADCDQGFVCNENGECVVSQNGGQDGEQTFIDELIAIIPFLGEDDPFARVLAAFAPGLFIVVLLLVLLPG